MLDRVVTALLTKKKKPAKNILKNSIIDNEPGLFENVVSFLTNYLLTVFFFRMLLWIFFCYLYYQLQTSFAHRSSF